jgi:hypothetical protein
MAFMSPEQALGDQLDRRSDLFSVGAVLFECVTGKPMWGAGSDVELMRKLALEHAPRLEPPDPRTPEALVALQARLVAREPAMRPATARSVAAELRANRVPAAGRDCEAALAALMKELFGAAAAERRALLAEALARAALSGIDDLRRTLGADDPRGDPAASGAEALDPPARRGARTVLLVGVGLATVAATAVVAAGAMRTPPAATAMTAAPAPAPSPSPAIAPTTATASAPPSAPAAAPAAAPPSAPAPAMTHGSAGVAGPAGRTRAGHSAKLRQAPAASKSAAKLPDVDPTPF